MLEMQVPTRSRLKSRLHERTVGRMRPSPLPTRKGYSKEDYMLNDSLFIFVAMIA